MITKPARPRRGRLFFATLLLLVVVLPTVAAHAGPRAAYPAPGTHISEPPSEVWIEFNEPVDVAQTTIQVFDANQTRVDRDDTHSTGENRVSVDLQGNLSLGTYIVQWTSVSTVDGHPTSGAWGFALGNGSVVPAMSTLRTPPFPWGTAVAKGLGFTGLSLLVGYLAACLWILPRSVGVLPERLHRLGLVGAALQLAGLVLYLIDGSRTAHASLWAYAAWNAFGRGLVVRTALAVGTAAALFLAGRRRDGVAFVSLVVLLAATLLAYGFYSHTAAKLHPRAAGGLLDAVHLLAVMAWSGGLVHLFVLLNRRSLGGEEPDLLVFASHRFSRLAIACIVVLTATGLLMLGTILGWTLGAWRAALGGYYGQLLAYKIFLALLMMGLGAVNHVIFIRRFDRHEGLEARPLFMANVRREAVNGFLILVLAAALTNLSPGVGA